MQEEFELGLACLKDLQRLEKEQKKLLRGLFKKMEGRAFQTFMKDEVVNLTEEEEPQPDSPLTDYHSPTPPGLAPLRLQIPVPFIAPPVPRRQDTPYPLQLQDEEEELQYQGCAVCLYDEERCAGCLRRIWGIRN
jgi:hypothetical protein